MIDNLLALPTCGLIAEAKRSKTDKNKNESDHYPISLILRIENDQAKTNNNEINDQMYLSNIIWNAKTKITYNSKLEYKNTLYPVQ